MNGVVFFTECKKIFSKKTVWIFSALVLIFYVFFQSQFQDSVGTTYPLEAVRQGMEVSVSNPELKALIRERDYSAGYDELVPFLDPSVLEYAKSSEASGERYLTGVRFDIANTINNYFQRIADREEEIRSLEDGIEEGSPALRRAKRKLLETYQNSPVEIEMNLGSWNEYVDINHAMFYPAFITLVLLLGVSGIYSDEYASNMQSLLLTCKKGRGRLFLAKLAASLSFAVLATAFFELFAAVMTALFRNFPGQNISAASLYGLKLSPVSWSALGLYLRQAAGACLSGIVMVCIASCVSAFSPNGLVPFFVSGAFYGGSALMAKITGFRGYLAHPLTWIGEFSPFAVQSIYGSIDSGHYVNLFGWIIPSLPAAVVWNILLAAGCILLCYKGYTGKQVQN